jgi:transcription initiation factor IIE alpha subunit
VSDRPQRHGPRDRHTLIPDSVLFSQELSDGAVRVYAALRRGKGRWSDEWIAEVLALTLDEFDMLLDELEDAGFVDFGESPEVLEGEPTEEMPVTP